MSLFGAVICLALFFLAHRDSWRKIWLRMDDPRPMAAMRILFGFCALCNVNGLWELFGYLFRPENGWGSGGADRKAIDYTPRPRRIHQGAAGGPDAFGCFSCHSKGGVDGAGTQTQNAFLRGDGERTGAADQRNAPHLLGLGPIACLAREMSTELPKQAAGARERAKADRHPVEQALTSKGVSFGHVTADPDGATPSATNSA